VGETLVLELTEGERRLLRELDADTETEATAEKVRAAEELPARPELTVTVALAL